jgi:Uma2 family endonuclease
MAATSRLALPKGAPVTTAFRFTSEDLECFPYIEGVRYEIIDGELYVSTLPQDDHQYACVVFASALHGWSALTGKGLTTIAPGLVFSPDNNVGPDVVWISHGRRAQARDEKGHYRLAPELVIEVLSPGRVNELRDRELKLQLYSRQDVQEYWIADWRTHTVEVYRREGAELRLVATLTDEDVLTSPLLPGFVCPVSTLWAPSVGA